MRKHTVRPRRFLGLLSLLLVLPGCATLQGLRALEQVDFRLDRVSDVRLAGFLLDRVQGVDDLGVLALVQISQALARGELPLSFQLDVLATNPEGNPEARLVGLDWTLFLQDRETVRGGLASALVIPVSSSTFVPLRVELDVLDFFQGNAQDLVNLALSLAGETVPPTEVRLEATPTVDTPLGPIRYPRPVTIQTTR